MKGSPMLANQDPTRRPHWEPTKLALQVFINKKNATSWKWLIEMLQGTNYVLNEDNGTKDFLFPTNIGKVVNFCCITKERNEI